jgi:hypothetical protein
VGVFTRPDQLLLRQRDRFAGVKVTIREATEALAEGGQEDFHSQTVGRLTTAMLRRIKHPYARRPRVLNIQKLSGFRGYQKGKVAQVTTRGRVADLPINRQTGRLKRGIRLARKKGGTEFDLYSEAPHARFVLAVGGTKHMRPRGLLGPKGLIRKRHKARHAGIVLAVRKANQKP